MTGKTIPTVDDLAADPVTHHYDDMIAPSGLTNFLGTVRVDHDLTAIGAVTFPPVSQGLTRTAVLFVDGRLFQSFGVPVTHAWRPDRVVRTAEAGGVRIETTTACVPGETAVAIDIRVTNTGAQDRDIRIALSVTARAVATGQAWTGGESPSATDRTIADAGGNRILFASDEDTTWSIQGLDRPATLTTSRIARAADDAYEVGIGGTSRGGELACDLRLSPGATERVGYVHVVGTDRAGAERAFDRVAADVPGALTHAAEFWNRQLTAVFTPGNDEYSGHLPVLETSSSALRRLYWWGVLGVIWFRRDFAGNTLGRSYDTLMPNYWATTTFIWDYSLSSLVHGLLDPEPMKAQLRHWIAGDIHTHFGTSSLTGGPVGRWYSVNDYAMTRLVTDYVRLSGDRDFLDEQIAASGTASSVANHLVQWAEAWKALRKGGPLADYGEVDNLLECVSSYTHEVAGLNAANVWCLRAAAEVQETLGRPEEAGRLRAEAEEFLPAILDLYLEGTGHFAARQPDGTRIPVRHCYDFSVVGTTIAADLDPGMRREMVRFFREELRTPEWMHALSPWDPDASYSVRPDHQWNGAYPAWPPDAARAAIALGAPEVVLDWIDGLARTANQGPCGQAHLVAEAAEPINGGARKAPPQLPYINDWACSSSGAWVALVLEGMFGLRVGLDGAVSAGGCVAELDPGAVLRGLSVAGVSYDVYADGRIEP